MKLPRWFLLVVIAAAWIGLNVCRAAPGDPVGDLALQRQQAHRFSAVFDYRDVTNYLSSDRSIGDAVQWCRTNGVTKVYLETFRGELAGSNVLMNAKSEFARAGLEVAACVTTANVGKPSLAAHYNSPCAPTLGYGTNRTESCYTDVETQNRIRSVFQYTARLFDEIIIDDFWFTECAGEECDRDRQNRVVTVGGTVYPVEGTEWESYRRELLVRLSEENILAAAREVNPNVKVIIKYPNWYDKYQFRGYDVVRQTATFDRIWAGTETRNFTDDLYGGVPRYDGYFIMRWLGGIGGGKLGGGWYDWLAADRNLFVEQARQTVLGGGRESVLFCYGGLQLEGSPEMMDYLRQNRADLRTMAEQVQRRTPLGVAAYKPVNSDPCLEYGVFGFAGMLGLPIQPCHEFPTNAPAALFSFHAWHDLELTNKLARYIRSGKATLITDGLERMLGPMPELSAPNVHVLKVGSKPASLLRFSRQEVDAFRSPLLRALKTDFDAPINVALYLFDDGSSVVENFTDREVKGTLNGKPFTVAARQWLPQWTLE